MNTAFRLNTTTADRATLRVRLVTYPGVTPPVAGGVAFNADRSALTPVADFSAAQCAQFLASGYLIYDETVLLSADIDPIIA